MKILAIIGGILAGAVSGLIGFVVYPGPLDKPVLGILAATAIVASGAWAMWEWRGIWAWAPYTLAVFATTVALMYAPPADDALAAGESVFSTIWMEISALACLATAGIARRRDRARAANWSWQQPYDGGQELRDEPHAWR